MRKTQLEAQDAWSVLNYLVADLLSAAKLYPLFLSLAELANTPDQSIKAVRRMYVPYLILTLVKFCEFYEHYKGIIPDGCKAACQEVYKELKRRHVKLLRNTFIGHILDKKTGRPISGEDANYLFNHVTGGNLDAFLNWIHTPGRIRFPESVLSIVEKTRDEIAREYQFL
jgi:hypothetical protein